MAADRIQTRLLGDPDVAFDTNVVAGNLLIVWAMSPTPVGTITITDSQGNTYSYAGVTLSDGAGGAGCRIGYTIAGSSAANTVSVVTGSEVADVVVIEVSGVTTTGVQYAAAASAGAGSANPNSGTITPSGAGYSVGFITNDTGTITMDGPLTEVGAGLSNWARQEYADVDGDNSSAFAASATASSRNWVAMAIHFQNTGGAGTTMTPDRGALTLTGATPGLGFTINMPDEL
jgi:hypothetical protein